MSYAVSIKNLNKRYKDFTLKNINLDIPTGCVFGLIGENGAGKSTLINSILGITRAEYGSLQFFEKNYESHQKEIKEDIAVIFEQTHFDQELTPKIIGKMLGNIYKKWDKTKYAELLNRFHLQDNKKIKKLSRGMKMQLEFAIAFSHDTKLLILDEATSGLDPIIRDEILELIREYCSNEDRTVIMSSHITSDLDKIADYIGFIHQGEMQFVKTYEEIRENYGVVKCGKEVFESLDADIIESFIKDDYGYRVLIQNKYELKNSFEGLIIENASVEDVMLFTVKGSI